MRERSRKRAVCFCFCRPTGRQRVLKRIRDVGCSRLLSAICAVGGDCTQRECLHTTAFCLPLSVVREMCLPRSSRAGLGFSLSPNGASRASIFIREGTDHVATGGVPFLDFTHWWALSSCLH